MSKVNASIPVLKWAADRANIDRSKLIKDFPKWDEWLQGTDQPTMVQLGDFAKKTHTAFGYFFLPKPPTIKLPISDFRTVGDKSLSEPSQALLDTLHICIERQDWYREHALSEGCQKLPFIKSVKVGDSALKVTAAMRKTLGLSNTGRIANSSGWENSLTELIKKAEAVGVMVMTSGIVGNNTRRKLNVEEFRGFVLVDDIAPVIFINGVDSKAAQMFTLAHELVHLWIGESGVLDTQAGKAHELKTEQWCNAVAAEFLVPLQSVCESYRPNEAIQDEVLRLAKEFSVSPLVVLRRLYDGKILDKATLWQKYKEEDARYNESKKNKGGGGKFYNNIEPRCSGIFTDAIISSAIEGNTLYRDAMRLTGLVKEKTFFTMAKKLELTA